MSPLTLSLLLLLLSGCFSSVDWALLAVPEICDGKDNDLDGVIDEELPRYYADVDGDGHGDPTNMIGCDGLVVEGVDCDDADPAVYPGAEERCDRLDNDCDRSADEGLPQYADVDGDGFGDPRNVVGCDAESDAIVDGTDCNDGDAGVYPGAPEVCGDGVVSDCELSLADARAACPAGELSLSGSDAILTGEAAGDWAGSVSGIGDQNGDSVEDFLVGALYNDRTGDGAGAAYVMYGPTVGEISLTNADAVLVGEAMMDLFGMFVCGAGNVNNDEYSDALISAHYSDGGGADSGAAYLFHGPLSGKLDASDAVSIFIGESANDLAGWEVTWTGDTNGDGTSDVLMGAPYGNYYGTHTGAAYLFSSVVSGSVSMGTADGIIVGDAPGDSAGYSLAGVGDTDGDGLSDVLVGAFGADLMGSNSGSASLFLGPIDGLFHLADARAILAGEVGSDYAGRGVQAAGDVNIDGYADVMVAAWSNDRGGDSSGAIYLLHGPLRSKSLSGAEAILVGEGEPGNFTTMAKTAQDLNGDDHPDLVFSDSYSDRGGDLSGTTYVVLSPVTGVLSAADADVLLTGEAAVDLSGQFLAALPDQDGDGLGELLIGARSNNRAGEDAGAAYLILGKTLWNY